MHIAGEFCVAGFKPSAVSQVYVVIIDEGGRNGYQRDIPRETAVVEPIVADRRNAVDEARGVHGDDNKVGSTMEDRGNFAIERSEAALVITDSFLVDPDVRTVVGRPDMEESARTWFGLGIKVSLIPEHALVVEKLRHLRVPVAWDFDGGSGSEVVFLVMIANDVGMLVQGVGRVIDPAISGV